MITKFLPRTSLALLATLALAGCGVSGPSNNRQLDFGAGEILEPNQEGQPQSTKIHPFTVSKNGEYQLRITALSAGPNVPMGLSLGTQAPGGGCAVLREGPAVLNQLAQSGPMFSGQYCVAIFDIGFLTAPTTYNIRALVP